MSDTSSLIQHRKTFAIISHPDAGKTTLTEKLLLYGGAIHLAGSVKARKTQKHAVSDWMEIEKQRGISVTSSVLQFDYQGYRVNILDTPGHQDFSEDTYRTLMAADSAVMLIDVAKGVEAQTKKLFQVCKQRHIPIFTFANKLDRFGLSPFDLLEEIEQVLGIRAYPMNWPIGTDGTYRGVYNRQLGRVELFERDGSHGQRAIASTSGNVDDPIFKDLLGEEIYQALCDDIALLDMAGDKYDYAKVLAGELTPMFFGSAMTNFGVQPFLEDFLRMAPPPAPRLSSAGLIDPSSTDDFSAFVFKIQANMNPAHRDRIAFIRICSGKFQRGMSVLHVQSGKPVKLSQPQQFLAQERTIVDEAFPGDIIGLFDPGIFGIGDSLCQLGQEIRFQDFPVFPPEQFARVQAKDTMKRKQFVKGMVQLTQEGAVQVFRQPDVPESFVIGVVGTLQFEVLQYRLKQEYGVDILMHPLPFGVARWLEGEDLNLDNLKGLDNGLLLVDTQDRPLVLITTEWQLNWVQDRNPGITFLPAPR
jgi:peptide chain release factor 3